MAKDLTAALHALTMEAQGLTSRVDKTLAAAGAATAIPERSGSAGPQSGNTGIASPLTETAFADREFFATAWKSSDGLFSLPAIKKIKMTDAAGREVIFNFKSPT